MKRSVKSINIFQKLLLKYEKDILNEIWKHDLDYNFPKKHLLLERIRKL